MAKQHKFDYVYPRLRSQAPAKWNNLKLGGRLTEAYGNGLWSVENKKVKLLEASVRFVDQTGGELRVKFDTKTWNPDKHGLLYTDRNWIKDLRKILVKKGFSEKAAKDVDYSEQGMQGDNYVSCDIGKTFLKEWRLKKLTVSEV